MTFEVNADISCSDKDLSMSSDNSELIEVEEVDLMDEIGYFIYFPQTYEGYEFSSAQILIGERNNPFIMIPLSVSLHGGRYQTSISKLPEWKYHIYVTSRYGDCTMLGKTIEH